MAADNAAGRRPGLIVAHVALHDEDSLECTTRVLISMIMEVAMPFEL
jgi:hypothetical protein